MDREEFENWLKQQDRETCVKVAVRAALRVFPVAAHYPENNLALLTARAILISGVAAVYPTPEIRFAAGARAAAGAAGARAAAYAAGAADAPVTVENIDAAIAAVRAVDTAVRTEGFDSAAFYTVEAANEATSSATDYGPTGAFVHMSSDATYSDTKIPPEQLLLTPLWHGETEPQWAQLGNNLLDTPAFAFWREWYQGFVDGSPMDWDLQYQVALIPDEDWEKGAEHIARLIEEIRARLALEKRIAELESALVVASGNRLGIGGNNPPEAIEAELPVAKELLVIWEPLQELKEEVEAEEPDKGRIVRAIEALGTALKAGLKWAAGKADLAVDTTIITTIKWGIPAVGGGYLAMNPDKITQVIEVAKHWLNALP